MISRRAKTNAAPRSGAGRMGGMDAFRSFVRTRTDYARSSVTAGGKHIRTAAVLFCAFSICLGLIRTVIRQEPLVAFCIVGILLSPVFLFGEWLLRFRMRIPVFLFAQLCYTLFVTGKCFSLFFIIPWWDIPMHILSGAVLAIGGLLLFRLLDPSAKEDGRKLKRSVAAVLFAVFFAITVGVFWEFYEYAVDRLFGWDMQMDTVVSSIDSTLLGDGLGAVGHIGDISETVVNGSPLPASGYVDIGLIDTMEDLLSLLAGALSFALIRLLAGGDNAFFTFPEKEAYPVATPAETPSGPEESA